MKTPQQLAQDAQIRNMLIQPPGPTPAMQEQMARAQAAKFVMEIASSIYVRYVSDNMLYHDTVTPEKLAEIAGVSFRAARMFLNSANRVPTKLEVEQELKAAGLPVSKEDLP